MKFLGLRSRRAKVSAAVATAYVMYFLFTWAVGKWLELAGWNLWILRGSLWLLGLVAAVFILVFTARRGGDDAGEADEDIDTTIAAARARLASARTAKGAGPGKLPLVIVIGPPGSAKTASVANSGLDPALLAGDAVQGDRIPPTRAVNCWYTQNTLILEAGGAVLQEPNRWARFVEHVVPDRLRATLTGRAQARRVAVVCYSCEELLKSGAATAVPAAAHDLRTRLGELSVAIGISLPVYVLFTKADRIPYFPEFGHHLSRDEAQLGVGETLRWPTRATAGQYAEREQQRIDEAFNRLFVGLAAGRLQLLARENDAARRAAVYEFPRELRKIAPLATQFLIELCRPSQLGISPVLRGVYFSGVRAVVMSDAAAPPPSAAAMAKAGGATQVFDGRLQQSPARDIGAPATGRKVPQWLFLAGVFRDVILRDRAGDAMAHGGVHVNLWRRGLLAAAAGISLLWLLGMPVSCVNNRRLAQRSFVAAQGLEGVYGTEADVPPPGTLTNLDRLRQNLETLADYERDGPPLRLRWGLYKGSALYRQLSKVYVEALEAVLLRPTRAAMVRDLRNVPDAPRTAGDYGRTYSLLKAYLMTTTDGKQIEPGFLDSVLMDRWREGRQVDSTSATLVRQQFEFYARKLCLVYPCGADNEGPVVSRARSFLLTYAGPEQIYQAIIAEASKQNRPVEFARLYPNAAAVLVNVYDVPGAFTPGGWAFMRGALANPDKFFKSENWVLGAQARIQLDRPTLLAQLRSMYDSDYVHRWATFIGSARLVPFGGPGDAARKLAQLSGNESPLLELFRLAAQNTNVDSQTIGLYLQPVHVVTPPTITDKFISDANKPYMDALIGLQTVVAQAGAAPGGAEALAGPTLERAGTARAAVAQLAQKFQVVGPAVEIGAAVRRLMEEPVARVEQILGSLPAQAANQRAAAFCTMLQALRSKYPVNPNGATEATLAEVASVFDPQTGAIAGLKNALSSALVRQGTRYLPVPGGAIRPTSAFVNFFNRAAGVSDALWPSGATEPRFTFSLRPTLSEAVPVVTVSVDGQVWQFTRTQLAARPFEWIGPRAREVRITAQIRGREEVLYVFGGTWAVFKLFSGATWRTTSANQLSGAYVVQWQVPQHGVTLEMELNLGQAPPFLRKDFFSSMGCVSRVQ